MDQFKKDKKYSKLKLRHFEYFSNAVCQVEKLKKQAWKNLSKKGKGSGFMDDWTILKKRAEQESFHSEAINQNDELAPGLRGWARPST